MTMRRLAPSAAAAAAAVALLLPGLAGAQPQYSPQSDSPQWLKDRRYNEGIGVRAGDLEIHPAIAGEFGYDSNWMLRSSQSNVSNGPDTPNTLQLRLSPSLYLSTLGPQRREGDNSLPPSVAFRAGLNATYREFFPVSDTQSAIGQDFENKQRNIGGAADARLDILPSRPVGGAIFGNYAHVIFPNQLTADANQSYTQEQVGAGAELAVQPGSGTLDWHFGYQFAGTFFDNQTAFNNYTNQAYTRGRWRFRPRTALLYDATLGWIFYPNATQAQTAAGLVDSTPVRARLGLNGLVTERFAAQAMLGWGSSFYANSGSPQPQFDSLLAQAELKWFLSASPGVASATELGLALSSIALGFTRDFQNSYFANYYTINRGYLKFNYFFAGRVAVNLEGGVGDVEYPRSYWLVPVQTQRAPAFTDIRADATLFGEYRVASTIGLNATLRYTQNFSNQVVPITPGGVAPGGVAGMAWQRFEAFVGFRWFM